MCRHSGTPRSSNAVLQTTTRDFSWSRGTQLWTAAPSTQGNRSLAVTYRCFCKDKWNETTADSLVTRAVMNFHIATQMKVDRSQRKFSTEKQLSLPAFPCILGTATNFFDPTDFAAKLDKSVKNMTKNKT